MTRMMRDRGTRWTLMPSSGSADAREVTSHHEAKHAGYATFVGFQVVTVDVSEGTTLCRLPCTPATLAAHWRQDPRQARRDMTNIVATVLAPYVGGVDAIEGGDVQQLQAWQQAWEALPPRLGLVPAPWPLLVESARWRVELWLCRPGVSEALGLLAHVLWRDGRVTQQHLVNYLAWPELQPLSGQVVLPVAGDTLMEVQR